MSDHDTVYVIHIFFIHVIQFMQLDIPTIPSKQDYLVYSPYVADSVYPISSDK